MAPPVHDPPPRGDDGHGVSSCPPPPAAHPPSPVTTRLPVPCFPSPGMGAGSGVGGIGFPVCRIPCVDGRAWPWTTASPGFRGRLATGDVPAGRSVGVVRLRIPVKVITESRGNVIIEILPCLEVPHRPLRAPSHPPRAGPCVYPRASTRPALCPRGSCRVRLPAINPPFLRALCAAQRALPALPPGEAPVLAQADRDPRRSDHSCDLQAVPDRDPPEHLRRPRGQPVAPRLLLPPRVPCVVGKVVRHPQHEVRAVDRDAAGVQHQILPRRLQEVPRYPVEVAPACCHGSPYSSLLMCPRAPPKSVPLLLPSSSSSRDFLPRRQPVPANCALAAGTRTGDPQCLHLVLLACAAGVQIGRHVLQHLDHRLHEVRSRADRLSIHSPPGLTRMTALLVPPSISVRVVQRSMVSLPLPPPRTASVRPDERSSSPSRCALARLSWVPVPAPEGGRDGTPPLNVPGAPALWAPGKVPPRTRRGT